jgi:pimeloyl-ACP methyl ester carboxylesterase
MLPAKGPWPHPYYDLPDAFVEVAFTDAQGNARHVRVRHKTLGDGPPLVLVHGLMTSSYSWRYVIDALSRRYRVFTPDLIGAGKTDKPGDLVYSVANIARFLAAYVRKVAKEPVYLVGNSLGGLYSVRAQLDEGASLAHRFVLMHAPGYPVVRTRALHTLLGAPVLGPGLASLVARVSHRWPRSFVANNVHYLRKDMMSEEECTEYGELFATIESARVFARILLESVDPGEHASIIGELRARVQAGTAFPCPVRILFAKKDVMVPAAFGPLFHADIPGSELVWMDDASLFLQVDAPERTVEQIVSFDGEARAAWSCESHDTSSRRSP